MTAISFTTGVLGVVFEDPKRRYGIFFVYAALGLFSASIARFFTRDPQPTRLDANGFRVRIAPGIMVERRWEDVSEFGLNNYGWPWLRVKNRAFHIDPSCFEDYNIFAQFIVSHLPADVKVSNIYPDESIGKFYIEVFRTYGHDLKLEIES